MNKGQIQSQDVLSFIIIVFGCLGFIIWGIGLSSIGNSTLRWLGGSIVALIGFLTTFLMRWLK